MPMQYTYANAGRNRQRADLLSELDMTLTKHGNISELRILEFRPEGLNVLNHPTFAAPTTTIDTGSGGR